MGIERNFNVAFVAEMALREAGCLTPASASHRGFLRVPRFSAPASKAEGDIPSAEAMFSRESMVGERCALSIMLMYVRCRPLRHASSSWLKARFLRASRICSASAARRTEFLKRGSRN
jgi:hypothetical protein